MMSWGYLISKRSEVNFADVTLFWRFFVVMKKGKLWCWYSCVCCCFFSWLSNPCWMILKETQLEQSTKCESSLHQSLSPQLSVLIWMPQQLYQPYALINACLCDTVLNLSLSPISPLAVVCMCFSLCLLVDLILPEMLHWYDRTWQDRPGHSRMEGCGGRQ